MCAGFIVIIIQYVSILAIQPVKSKGWSSIAVHFWNQRSIIFIHRFFVSGSKFGRMVAKVVWNFPPRRICSPLRFPNIFPALVVCPVNNNGSWYGGADIPCPSLMICSPGRHVQNSNAIRHCSSPWEQWLFSILKLEYKLHIGRPLLEWSRLWSELARKSNPVLIELSSV